MPRNKKRKKNTVGQTVSAGENNTEQTTTTTTTSNDNNKPQQHQHQRKQKQKPKRKRTRPKLSTDEPNNASITKHGVVVNDINDSRDKTKKTSSKGANRKNNNNIKGKNKDDDKNNDNSTTINNNNDNSDKNILIYLEEQVRIHEITLQAWGKRRDQILTQREIAIVTKRRLLDQRDKILVRQKNLEEAKVKHLPFQANLIESLSKSRERLRRLTILLEEEGEEQEQAEDNDIDDRGNSISVNDVIANANANTKSSLGGLEDSDNFQSLQENQNTLMKQGNEHHPLLFNPYRISNSNNDDKELIRYHNFSFMSQPEISYSRRSLLSFLPSLDATQVGDYLTLMLREAKALDENNNQNLEKSLRRKLIENTSLDILLLGPSSSNEKLMLDTIDSVVFDFTECNSTDDNQKDCDDIILKGTEDLCNEGIVTTQSEKITRNDIFGSRGGSLSSSLLSDSKLYSINPNISLCPYELDGVCADDLCPYQHTTKDTKVMARERLPLPSLSSFLSSITIESKSKLKNGKTQPTTTTVEANTETVVATPEATTKHDGIDVDIEGQCHKGNIIQSSETPSDNEGEDSFDNAVEEIDQNVCGGEKERERDEEDLIMLPPSSSHVDGHGDEEDENESDTKEHKLLLEELQNDGFESGSNSGDEVQEGSLSLSAPSSLTQDTDMKTRECDIGTLWWGGKLPSSHNTFLQTDASDIPFGKVELSITDILEDTFGMIIHIINTSETKTAATKSSLSSSCDARLEVKGMPVPSDNIMDWLKTLGRLVDASRLALHGGLDCIAITVSRMNRGDRLFKDRTCDHVHSVVAFLELIKIQTEVSWFYEKESFQLSCFQTSFVTQMGMSILSWSLGAKWRTLYLANEEDNRTKKDSFPHLITLEAVCTECWDILRHPTVKDTNTMPLFVGEELNRLLWKDTSQNITTHIASQNKSRENDNYAANSVDQLSNLKYLILWAQEKFAIPSYNKLHASDQRLEERLKDVWLVARTFLLKYQKSGSLEQSNLDFQCLKVVIVMAYAIFGCLTSFATAVANGLRNRDRSWRLSSSHSGSNLAAWTLLDASIVRILKDLRRHIVDVPLLDLALAPLYSCSIASASFLRNYSAAQHRLEDCLRGTSRNPSFNMLSYSELMWSQLVQLRMSLPNESTTSSPIVENLPTGKKPSQNNDCFSWEPSSTVKEENRLLIAKLESTGIYLRHVVLLGDWMLSLIQANDADNSTTSKKLLMLQTDTSSKTNQSALIHMKKDLRRLQNLSTSVGRAYPPASPLPQLPLFLLYSGHSLTGLNLDRCCLDRLPRSFGLYFPNLKKLNLSHNELKELPESFQNMCRRMKFLQEFHANHNRLGSLPSNIFSNTTGIGSAVGSSSSTFGSSSQKTQTSPLRILDLSYNCLTSIPSLVATTLTHLEVLKINNNLLVDVTMIDLSRVALKLPMLREMTHQNQNNTQTDAVQKQG